MVFQSEWELFDREMNDMTVPGVSLPFIGLFVELLVLLVLFRVTINLLIIIV